MPKATNEALEELTAVFESEVGALLKRLITEVGEQADSHVGMAAIAATAACARALVDLVRDTRPLDVDDALEVTGIIKLTLEREFHAARMKLVAETRASR